ncbi:L-gulonolactone oxidase-like isoform X1 [Dermacentor albipictus]|uniref:L-gulonolactone oxidase-like isoform X1 n=1 Tax=Dermacentor albipictus TaxID=60249 RepID=UPI0031FCC18B
MVCSSLKGVTFENWSKTFTCRPEHFFEPKDQDELLEVLDFARQHGKKVRVVGAGFSPSDIACTSEVMISMLHLNKVLKVDKARATVKAEAGITLKKLNEVELAWNGLALMSLGAVSDITLGGAIATGVHGSGLKYGIFSTQVLELELITSTGQRLCCSETENKEVFWAACCGLGSIGIVITATVQCEPAFRLREVRYSCELQQVLENLDVHLQSSDHFRCLWYPHSDTAVCFHLTRTNEEITKPSFLERVYYWIVEYAFGYYAMEFLLYLSTWFPSWVPWLNKLFLNIVFAPRRQRVDVSYRVFNYECRFKQHVNEWSIPREKTALALRKLKEWIDSTPGASVHIPVEIRFVQADNTYLSPASGRDSCYINVIMYRPYGKKVAYECYWAAYENIMKSLGGRPHWAKAYDATSKEFQVMYPNFSKWCVIRQKLDPQDMFLNPYMKRVLGS